MFPQIDKRATGINLRKMMDKRDITVKQVQEYLQLGSVQSVYHWLNGSSMPTIDNLYALSELLQVPIDVIVRGNRKPVWLRNSKLQRAKDSRLYTYYVKLSKSYGGYSYC